MTNWRMGTSTIDSSQRGPAGNSQVSEPSTYMKPQKMNHPAIDRIHDDRRKGVKRTVTICIVVVAAFFLVSFVQIMLMK